MNSKVVILGVREPVALFLATVIELAIKHAKNQDKVYLIEWDNDSKYFELIKKITSRIKDSLSKSGINTRIKVLTIFDRISAIPEMIHKGSPGKSHYFENIENLKQYKQEGFAVGIGVASSLISLTRDHQADTKQHEDVINSLLSTSIQTYRTFKAYLERIKPGLVYIFNGRFAETKAALAAVKDLGIEYIIYEAGGTSDKYWLFQNSNAHDFDAIQKQIKKLWNNSQEDKITIAQNWYEKRRNGIETYYYSPKVAPDSEYVINNNELKLGFTKKQVPGFIPLINKSKKNIAIFGSSIDEFSSIEDENFQIDFDENKIIKKIIGEFKNDNSIHFYLRIHPNLENMINTQMKHIKELDSKNNKILTVIYPDEKIDTYELINSSDIILSFGSTVGIECVMMDKPSICFNRSYYDKLDSVYLPNSIKELFTMLKSDLKPKPKLGALMYGYWFSRYGESFEYFENIIVNNQNNLEIIYKNKLFKMEIHQKLLENNNSEVEILF